MTRERRIGLLMVGVVALAVLFTAAAFVAYESRALRYTLLFDDAKGIVAGDRVQMGGVSIGVVKWVKLYTQPTRVEINVKIDPEYAAKVREDSTAVIRNVSFPNVSGQMVVEIVNPETKQPAAPMKDNASIAGVENPFELEFWKLKREWGDNKDGLMRKVDLLRDRISKIRDEVKDFAASPQVRETIQELTRFLDEMRGKGAAALDQLQARWPALKEKLAPVIKELQTLGRDYVVKQLKQIVQQIDETLDKWRKAAPAPETPAPPAAPTPA